MSRTLADYKPQHDYDCGVNRCVHCEKHRRHRIHVAKALTAHECSFDGGACSCGLERLLSLKRGRTLQDEDGNCFRVEDGGITISD